VLRSLEIPILACQAAKVLFCIPLFLVLCVPPALSQKAQPSDLPEYDLHTETKTKGVEVNLLPFGTRKDFTELIIRSGGDQLHVYVCPQPFQEEMGISFSNGDEVAVTGSKVKQDASDVILAREL
jgi:hypothetical protein